SGIGPKTAKLIVISLSNKVGLSVHLPHANVIQALVQLGTDEARARAVISEIPVGLDDSAALKAALSLLGSSKLGEA
ncbi:MAG: hypothetical protein RL696_784, partial [Actinomycetota bacterium]